MRLIHRSRSEMAVLMRWPSGTYEVRSVPAGASMVTFAEGRYATTWVKTALRDRDGRPVYLFEKRKSRPLAQIA